MDSAAALAANALSLARGPRAASLASPAVTRSTISDTSRASSAFVVRAGISTTIVSPSR
jgi:hypothetical protein